jgi:hypothetical protein
MLIIEVGAIPVDDVRISEKIFTQRSSHRRTSARFYFNGFSVFLEQRGYRCFMIPIQIHAKKDPTCSRRAMSFFGVRINVQIRRQRARWQRNWAKNAFMTYSSTTKCTESKVFMHKERKQHARPDVTLNENSESISREKKTWCPRKWSVTETSIRTYLNSIHTYAFVQDQLFEGEADGVGESRFHCLTRDAFHCLGENALDLAVGQSARTWTGKV